MWINHHIKKQTLYFIKSQFSICTFYVFYSRMFSSSSSIYTNCITTKLLRNQTLITPYNTTKFSIYDSFLVLLSHTSSFHSLVYSFSDRYELAITWPLRCYIVTLSTNNEHKTVLWARDDLLRARETNIKRKPSKHGVMENVLSTVRYNHVYF